MITGKVAYQKGSYCRLFYAVGRNNYNLRTMEHKLSGSMFDTKWCTKLVYLHHWLLKGGHRYQRHSQTHRSINLMTTPWLKKKKTNNRTHDTK